MQQVRMSNKSQQQRSRSKSRRKGISVSLTPSKVAEKKDDSVYDISRCTINPINQLPVVNYQSSSKQQYKCKFVHQLPHLNNNCFLNETQGQCIIKPYQRFNDHAWQIRNLQNGHSKTRKQQTRSYPYDVQNSPQDIRPSVFTIVDQIYKKVNQPPKKKQNISIPNKQTRKEQPGYQKVQNYGQNKESLKIIHQNNMQRSVNLADETQNYRKVQTFESTNKNLPNCINIQRNNLLANQLNSKRPNVARLKMAQQKLIRIIQVCDYGL